MRKALRTIVAVRVAAVVVMATVAAVVVLWEKRGAWRLRKTLAGDDTRLYRPPRSHVEFSVYLHCTLTVTICILLSDFLCLLVL